MGAMTVSPAYGRDYNSKAAALADWAAGKDFVVCDPFHGAPGAYINKADADCAGLQIKLRYKRLTQAVMVPT